MTNHKDDWDPCPAGQVAEMVTGLRREKRQAITRQLATLAGSLLLGVVIVACTLAVVNQSPSAKIGCDEVIANMANYRQDLLSTELAARIQSHLLVCPSCKRHYDAGASLLGKSPVEVTRHEHPRRSIASQLALGW